MNAEGEGGVAREVFISYTVAGKRQKTLVTGKSNVALAPQEGLWEQKWIEPRRPILPATTFSG